MKFNIAYSGTQTLSALFLWLLLLSFLPSPHPHFAPSIAQAAACVRAPFFALQARLKVALSSSFLSLPEGSNSVAN